jgi:ArsR family transcriptional regulator
MSPIEFFKCLADDTRLRSLLLIEREGELCVCELTAALSLSQPKISRHLALLRKQELLLDRRQGQWVFYRINPNLAPWAQSVLAQTLAANQSLLADNLKQLYSMGERPQCVRSHCC